MAISSNNLIGDTRGNVGGVNFTKQNGKQVVRTRIQSPLNRKTEKQQWVRAKFLDARNFYKFLQDFAILEQLKSKERQEKFNTFYQINKNILMSDYTSNLSLLSLYWKFSVNNLIQSYQLGYDDKQVIDSITFKFIKDSAEYFKDIKANLLYFYYDIDEKKIVEKKEILGKKISSKDEVLFDIYPKEPLNKENIVYFNSLLYFTGIIKGYNIKSFGLNFEVKQKPLSPAEKQMKKAFETLKKKQNDFSILSAYNNDFNYFLNLNKDYKLQPDSWTRGIKLDEKIKVNINPSVYTDYRLNKTGNLVDAIEFRIGNLFDDADVIQLYALIEGTAIKTGEKIFLDNQSYFDLSDLVNKYCFMRLDKAYDLSGGANIYMYLIIEYLDKPSFANAGSLFKIAPYS